MVINGGRHCLMGGAFAAQKAAIVGAEHCVEPAFFRSFPAACILGGFRLPLHRGLACQPWKLLRQKEFSAENHALQSLVMGAGGRWSFQATGSLASFLPSAVCLGAAHLAVGRMPEQRLDGMCGNGM